MLKCGVRMKSTAKILQGNVNVKTVEPILHNPNTFVNKDVFGLLYIYLMCNIPSAEVGGIFLWGG